MIKQVMVSKKMLAISMVALSAVAFFSAYVTQVVSAQIAKDSSLRVMKSTSCTPESATKETVHFSGCSSII